MGHVFAHVDSAFVAARSSVAGLAVEASYTISVGIPLKGIAYLWPRRL